MSLILFDSFDQPLQDSASRVLLLFAPIEKTVMIVAPIEISILLISELEER